MKSKVNIGRLDDIIKRTVKAINSGRSQIFEIAESAKKECRQLEADLKGLREQVIEMIDTVNTLEQDLKNSKRRLALLSKNLDNRSESELREAYEKADSLRVELAVKREQEQNLIMRRNEVEIRLKESYKTVERAENLTSQIAVAMGYLSGDLSDLSSQLHDIQQIQTLGTKIIRAQEEERQRVAREIHDGPAQSMSNVVLKADICEKLIDVDIDRTKNELRTLKNIVRGCLQDVRRIIYDLRPMSLDDLGLVPTLQRYASNYRDETSIDVHLNIEGTYEDLNSAISITIYRIIQEALNNVRKHSQATMVVINISTKTDHLNVSIFDNGKGFDVEEVSRNNQHQGSGFGLYSMKERAELLRGTFEVKSDESNGTRIKIMIPLSNEEAQNEKDTGSNSG